MTSGPKEVERSLQWGCGWVQGAEGAALHAECQRITGTGDVILASYMAAAT